MLTALPCISRKLAIVLFAFVQAWNLIPSSALVQAAQNPPGDHWAVRPCNAQSRSSKASPRKSKSKNRGAQPDSTNGCLEVAAGSLEVQERLQAIVRDNRWSVLDEDTDESSWTFSLQLTRDELVADTKPDAVTEQMQWTSGKAAVVVQTAELPDGYTRVTITSRFDGFGESEDKFAPERALWKLKSNGRLEAGLIDALRARLKKHS